jgi:hypothetical protein
MLRFACANAVNVGVRELCVLRCSSLIGFCILSNEQGSRFGLKVVRHINSEVIIYILLFLDQNKMLLLNL